MSHVIDLGRRAWTRHRGPLTLIGTWLRIDERWRPCMAIIRAGDEFSDDVFPCIVTMDKAWIWSREVGDEILAGQTLAGFLDPLRLTPDDRTIIWLYNLINDHLQDLLTIPPYLPEQGDVTATISITDHRSGTTREVEIRDDV